MSEILRVAYYSQNRIEKSDSDLLAEIDRILVTSQRNNSNHQVTGALVFNRGVFGQVLEGPRGAVEKTFERIQFDMRHDNVTVLDVSPVEGRFFRDWSMGYVGSEDLLKSRFEESPNADGFNIDRLSGDEMFGLLRNLAVANELSHSAL